MPKNIQIHQTYDAFSNVTSTTDPLGHTIKTNYNGYNKPITTIYPDNTEETNTYNLDGTLQESIAKNGMKTTFAYDLYGRLIKKMTYSEEGELLSTETSEFQGQLLVKNTDAENFETFYSYDGAGREIAVIQGDAKTTFSYDALGRKESTTHWDGENIISKECKNYDFEDQVIASWTEDAFGNSSLFTQYTYDPFGNCTHVIQGDEITTNEYDPHKRLRKTIDPLGNTTYIDYIYTYRNENGERVMQEVIIDPKGQKTLITYNVLNHQVSIEKQDSLGTLLSRTYNGYDLIGNLIHQTHQLINREGDDQELLMEYDSLGRLITLTEAPHKPLQRITTTTYNRLGQKENITKPNGVILSHTYDAKGRLKTLVSSDNTISYEYLYDKKDQLLSLKDLTLNQTTTRTYTQRGQVASETLATGLTVYFTYDPLDRVTKVTLPDDSALSYTYNPFTMESVTRLNPQQEPLYTHTYDTFNHQGLLKEETLVDGSKRFYSYDANHQLKSQTSTHTELSEYDYDPIGNLLSYTHNGKTFNYTYDCLYQLSEENDHTYTHDSLYNRTSKDSISYTLNALNQISQITDTEYTYDLNGNLIKQHSPTSTTLYTYDALDRLTKATVNDITYNYSYDGFHRRLTSNNLQFLYLKENEVGAYRDNTLIEFRTLGLGKGAEIGASIALELNGELYTPHHDHQGNLILLTQNNTEIDSYTYTAFGEHTSQKNLSPWRFSSKRYDQETDLTYFGRRYYTASLGRWLTADPLGYDAGSNLYAYVMNTPLTHFDFYGLIDSQAFDRDDDYSRGECTDCGLLALCNMFSNAWNFKDGSQLIYVQGSKGINPPNSLAYILNGMNNTLPISMSNGQYFSELMGGYNFFLRYNPSHNQGDCYPFENNPLGIAMDIARCIYEFSGMLTDTTYCVKKDLTYLNCLARMHKTRTGSDIGILLAPFSEGNIIMANALENYMLDKSRLSLIGCGPGKKIPQGALEDYIYLQSTGDPVAQFTSFLLPRRETNTVNIPPAQGCSQFADHEFQGPTLRDKLRSSINNYFTTGKVKQ
ncbi:hypothetical protein N9Y92_02610 [Chlamydiales bacterium]|nr:hypothetical protein [Chlamydiales bacterium]